jgi:prepilin-type N-terminal cleavage/methylation domain-containing protein
MLNRLKKSNSEGFTIIEVMIVLAIAGLILLIVFLAVPALQRNARNTSRKSDVGSLLAAVSEYESNNNGSLPAASGTFTASFTNVNPNLGYYTTPANVTYVSQAAATAPSDPNDLDKVVVANFAKCSGNAPTTTGATARSIIALYDVEGNSGTKVPQCRES